MDKLVGEAAGGHTLVQQIVFDFTSATGNARTRLKVIPIGRIALTEPIHRYFIRIRARGAIVLRRSRATRARTIAQQRVDDHLLDSPGQPRALSVDVHVDAGGGVAEGEIDVVEVVVSVVPAQVLTRDVLHLEVELVAVVAALSEKNAQPVGPVIDEEKSRPEVDSVVSRAGE